MPINQKKEGYEAFPLCATYVFGTVQDKAVMLLWGSIVIDYILVCQVGCQVKS
jgi:hypothetical protein